MKNKKAQRRRAGRTLGSLPLNLLRLRNLIETSPKRLSRGKKRKSRYKEQIKSQKAQEKAKREANKKKEQEKVKNKKAQRRRAGRTLGSLPLNLLRLRNLIKTSPKRLSRGKKRKTKRRK